ncbi:MAG: SpoIID/LytB domain-containing protein [Simkaniaceae bacterium]|nr:SpoIID/LytB domain-containing protein [Simkaniaceae bacterium]
MHINRLIPFALCLLLSLPSTLRTEGVTRAIEPTDVKSIKVLMHKDKDSILFEAKGPFSVFDPNKGRKVGSGRYGKRFRMVLHEEGIKWGEHFLGIFQLRIVPEKPGTTFLINGVQVRGAVAVYHVENKLAIVNEVDMEHFLKSTLPARLPADNLLPEEVLDAVAIVARTDAYHTAVKGQDLFYHVDAEVAGYTGCGLTLREPRIERAIDDTRRLIMTFEGRSFPATWTEHSGGKTAPYARIFGKDVATPPGVTSVFSARGRALTRWNYSISTEKLAELMRLNRITGIDPFVDSSSRKTYALRIRDGVHPKDIDFLSLRALLGNDALRSNDFTVRLQEDHILFEGYGRGTGTGLCLYGASEMAERGDDAPAILSTFFPKARIEKIFCRGDVEEP